MEFILGVPVEKCGKYTLSNFDIKKANFLYAKGEEESAFLKLYNY